MSVTAEPKLSAPKRAAKSILAGSRRRLPAPLYDAGYSFLYSAYRGLLRSLYFPNRFAQSGAARTRSRRVFRALRYSLVGASGLEVSHDAVSSVVAAGVPGDIVECGVAQGGCAGLMGLAMLDDQGAGRRLWLFDSFEGLPDPTAADIDPAAGSTGSHVQPLLKGSCLGTVDEVSHVIFDYFGIPKARVRMVQGWFEDTLTPARKELNQVAVLRIDGDWYESTKTCLFALYDRVSPGGFVIMDDYDTCYGAKRAAEEFFETLPAGQRPADLLSDGRGGRYFQKLH